MKGFKQHYVCLGTKNVALSISAWMVEGWYFQTGIDQIEYGSYLWEAVEELSTPVKASCSRLFVKVTLSWFFIFFYEKWLLLSQGQVLCSVICNIFSVPCSHRKVSLCPLHLRKKKSLLSWSLSMAWESLFEIFTWDSLSSWITVLVLSFAYKTLQMRNRAPTLWNWR